ncbi:M50 family metallopeptidase [Candidatus Woesearchaeota archaeon]|nr:M50 family metallopeptidase [Candidatus Woesearchaeota archaeon]
MLFSVAEIIDIVIMTGAIGFIFKDVFKRRPKVEVLLPKSYDPLSQYNSRFNWNDFWFAVAVVGPSVILHEFGHKFFAIANGMSAEFHAAYTWLIIGLILKLLSFGFIFFVPAYVSISGGTALQMAGAAFAGPAVNLILWLGASAILKHNQQNRRFKGDLFHLTFLTSRINMFLFIFNMLPIPGFDGWNFLTYLSKAIF